MGNYQPARRKHLLDAKPFCELLILHSEVSNAFFLSDLFEEPGQTIYAQVSLEIMFMRDVVLYCFPQCLS